MIAPFAAGDIVERILPSPSGQNNHHVGVIKKIRDVRGLPMHDGSTKWLIRFTDDAPDGSYWLPHHFRLVKSRIESLIYPIGTQLSIGGYMVCCLDDMFISVERLREIIANKLAEPVASEPVIETETATA